MQIEIVNLEKKITANEKNILFNLLENNIAINNFCNGKGTCGKCKIKVLEGELNPLTKSEKNLLSDEQLKENIRLACLSQAKTDVKIEIYKNKSNIKVLDQGIKSDFEMIYKNGYGLAVDIGTTTLVTYLVDLSNGEIIDKISAINSQSKYGLDVMTRISFEYENENGKELLQEEIIKSLNQMIYDLSNKNNMPKDLIKEIVVAANTTMLHMLVGKDARSLGKYPYKAEFLQGLKINSKDIGLNLDAILYTLPNVSAFVGSDIVAGVYLTELKYKKDTLFIDIGTNGEIVLKAKDKLYCCSTAAGPALEGMNIECGMRAESGAIEAINLGKDEISLITIENDAPLGICGSGLLSAVSQIVDNDLVNKRGRIIDPKKLEDTDYRKKYIKENKEGKRYIVLDEQNNVFLSQKDIRQVQLAKGAILSGLITLLKRENMELTDLNSVIIAGGFGSHLKKEDITGVGILPKEVENLISYVGNSSLIGAYIALMNDEIKNQMQDLSSQIEYIDLSTSENYDKTFARSMQFN